MLAPFAHTPCIHAPFALVRNCKTHTKKVFRSEAVMMPKAMPLAGRRAASLLACSMHVWRLQKATVITNRTIIPGPFWKMSGAG